MVSHLLHWSRQSSPQFILYKRNADRLDINIKIDLHIIFSRNAILVLIFIYYLSDLNRVRIFIKNALFFFFEISHLLLNSRNFAKKHGLQAVVVTSTMGAVSYKHECNGNHFTEEHWSKVAGNSFSH